MPFIASMAGEFGPLGRSAAFNSAIGGTETIVFNYNNTGQTWRVHTFSSSGTLTVLSALKPFRVLAIAGGGGGAGGVGNIAQGGVGGSGGAGGMLENQSVSLDVAPFSVVVGSGGLGVLGDQNPGTAGAGGPSSLTNTLTGSVAISVVGGGGGSKYPSSPGGSGGSGGGGCSFVGNWGGPSGGGSGILGQGTNGANGGGQGIGPAAGGGAGSGLSVDYSPNGRVSSITGTSLTYSPGEGIGNGGSGRDWSGPGSNGSPGIVIVAYRIG